MPLETYDPFDTHAEEIEVPTRSILRRVLLFCGAWCLLLGVFLCIARVRLCADGITISLRPEGFYLITWHTVWAVALALAFAVVARWKRLYFLAPRGPRAWAALVTLILAILLYLTYWSLSFALPTALMAGLLLWRYGEALAGALDKVLLFCASWRGMPMVVVLLTLGAVLGGSLLLFDGNPYGVDSYARYFHARILAMGRWYLPAPMEWADCQSHIAVGFHEGRMFSQYLPGTILLNLLGLKVGSLPLVFGAVAAGTVATTYLFGRRLYGHGTALLGAALLAVSPMFFLLSTIFMEHTPAALFLMAAAWAGMRSLERPCWRNAAAMGFLLGMACITRPLTALGVAGPLLVVWAYLQLRQGRKRWAHAAIALGAWGLPMAFLLYFNWKTYGSALMLGYGISNPELHRLGFDGNGGHTPWLGLTYQLYHINALSRWMHAWPVTSYFFMFLLFVAGRVSRKDAALLLPFAGLLCAYFFYGYINIDLTPRFVMEAVPFLALLSARGMVEAGAILRSSFLRMSPRQARIALALLLVLFALHFPEGAGNRILRFHRDYEVGEKAVAALLRPYRDDPLATVFIRTLYGHRTLADLVECWGGAQFLCDPGEEKRKAYMARHPERHYQVLEHWPGR